MASTESCVTIHMVASLDGFIARKDGRVDWLETSDEFEDGDTLDPEITQEFLKTIDCYVMGSRTLRPLPTCPRADPGDRSSPTTKASIPGPGWARSARQISENRAVLTGQRAGGLSGAELTRQIPWLPVFVEGVVGGAASSGSTTAHS
jgi:hypothetical protein